MNGVNVIDYIIVRTKYNSSNKDGVLARRPWARYLDRIGLRYLF